MKSDDLLRSVPLFSRLNGRQIARLVKLARRQSFPAGSRLFRRGDTAVALYVLLSGRVQVSLPLEEGKPDRLLGEIGPGEVFGEMAIIDEAPRSATVSTVEPTECLVLNRWDFVAEMRRDPEIARALLPVLCARIRELHEHLLAHEAASPEGVFTVPERPGSTREGRRSLRSSSW